jgi:hypothetical protein
MMDSFVEAQNNLKRMSYAKCVTLFETRQSHAARFSFMPMVMKSPGLKPIEAQNARSSSARVLYLASTHLRTIAQISASHQWPTGVTMQIAAGAIARARRTEAITRYVPNRFF